MESAKPPEGADRMSLIERWAVAGNDLPTPGEVRICSIRPVATGDPAFAGEVEVVPADQLAEVVEAIRAHRDRWVKANGTNPDMARPADLELWALIGGIEAQS
jgi:hypothetical protein